MEKSNFNIYSKYYNLLYKDKDYKKEVRYILNIFKQFHIKTNVILEIGSGTGKHAKLLEKKGYEVVGIEKSKEMVDISKRNGFSPILSDSTIFNLNKQFEVIISMFHVVSYLSTNKDLISTFKNVNSHLKKGGLFIFDVWYTPAVYNLKALSRLKKIKNNLLEITRFAEPDIRYNENIVDVNYSVIAKDLETNNYSEFKETHRMRHYSLPEINLLAQFTGFEVIKFEEFLTSKALSENTWGACFVLKKI